ncbi:MAG TPA: tetratricopeptide repeat protein [Candidatus Kryptonia bacterium]|nr:tetratricopeptide repeat protein [Candidatus Kryptonia bacterium]
MLARIGYAILAVGLFVLIGVFVVRVYRGRPRSLPSVAAPAEIAGQPCQAALETARELTRRRALERARQAYLWLATHCDDSPVQPEALLEAGSLLGHLLNQPHEAQQVYERFLGRFGSQPGADAALYHLAKLRIDAGDYAAAITYLSLLAERYPTSEHRESAQFLTVKAAEMLAARRQALRSVSGQVAQLVPNNFFSLLALLAAVGPSLLQIVVRPKSDFSPARRRLRWVQPSLVVGLTFLNYVMNNLDLARRNADLMEKLDEVSSAVAQFGGNP